MDTTDQKQEKPDLLKQMSSVVGHELRNPLAIISNSVYYVKTKLAAGGAVLDPKVAKHLGIIEAEVKHSNDVIEEMSLFTRPRDLSPKQVSLNDFVTDLAAYYKLPPTVTLKTIPDPSDPRSAFDTDTISKAVNYVLDNAVQAMFEGGVITIEISHDAKCAHIAVTDTGPGLPDGDGEKVFVPFFTTKPRGIGLGLTITRKFLELHNGAAKAAPVRPHGARITLSLPLIQ